MKKTLRTMLLALVLAVCLAFTGCGISQSAADKINEAMKNGEPMTVAEVKKKYGEEPTYEALTAGSGVIVYVDGCDTWEEVEEKLKNGDNMKAMIVTCLLGNATGAVYNDNYKGEKK